VEELPLEADGLAQVESLAKESGCQWLVLPSSGDRYLPEAFATVARRGERRNQTIVGACRVLRNGQPYSIGPAAFRFDYFALLSGFSYIAPGATFISVDQLLESGGFDPRFPNALTYKFLLMIGAAHGVDWCSEPVLETEANPFPGIPAEVAVLYAAEVLSASLDHNPGLPAPGATLGLVASLGEYLEPMQSLPFYDEHLVWAIGLARSRLRDRYHEYLGLTSVSPPGRATGGRRLSAFSDAAPHGTPVPPPGSLHRRIRTLTPTSIWNTLRRAKLAWKAFSAPQDY
jgi:hypothetical protein